MLKKLHVLAAAYRLRSFTVADLSAACGVTEGTVHTVILRAPKEWFTSKTAPAGTRGGQPLRYELTEAGVAGIKESMGRLPTAESLAPPQPELTMPMGLLAAKDSLRRLPGSTPEAANILRDEALRSLDWAENEVNDGGFASEAEAIRAQIAQSRALLQVNADTTEQLDADYIPATTPALLRHFEKLMASFRASAYEKDFTKVPLRKIVISYFGGDTRSREMASFANGAIARELHNRGERVEMGEPVEARKLMEEIARMRGLESTGRRMRLFMCVSDPDDAKELESVLAACPPGSAKTWVLDSGFNQRVERVTRSLQVTYQPNASKPDSFGWVDAAIS